MRKLKGLKLIEILVVIAIVGLIISIAMVAVRNSKERARITNVFFFDGIIKRSLGAYSAGIWDFNEGGAATTTQDFSGNGNTGVIAGADWTCAGAANTPSGTGCSLYFIGANSDFVNCGNNNSLNIASADKVTVMAWVKIIALPAGNAGVVSKRNATTTNYELGITSAGKIFNYNGTATNISIRSVPIGQWRHIAMSINQGTVTFYLDGVADNSASSTTGTVHQGNLFIGKGTPTGEFFNGLIDDVRIYRESITLTQIQKIYAEGAERLGIAKK